MSAAQLVTIGLAVLAGCVLQTTVGFGLGLLAIPLILWSGVSLPDAIGVSLGVLLIQTLWSCYRHRADFSWRETLPITWWRLASLPAGVGVLGLLVEGGPARTKQAVGAAVLLALVLQGAFRVRPRAQLAWPWTAAAGLSSGFLAGLVGMGGPPLVLWVLAHDWPSRKARSFLWATMLLLVPPAVAVLVWRFGWGPLGSFGIGVACLPLIILGARLGHALGGRLSPARLRWAAFGVLTVIALTSLIGPWLGWMV